MREIKAVITADIVNSSLLDARRLNSLLRSFKKIFSLHDILFDFYRGDSFYALCDASVALRIVFLLRSLAISNSKNKDNNGIDVRMSIGLGQIEEPFDDLSTAKGEAFVLSGREMDQMDKEGPRLSIRCHNMIADTGLAAVASFSDYILKKMTVKQSQVIHELLKGSIQVEAARKLHKAQSTINKHANTANWKELTRLLEIYEKLINQLAVSRVRDRKKKP